MIRAAERTIEIIGEAAGKLSKQFRTAHPDMPWDAIIGMRHRIVHEYFRVDLLTLWHTVDYDLPNLKDWLQQHLAK